MNNEIKPPQQKVYGKTSKRRQEDPKKVRKNWDDIKGFRPSKYK